MELDFGFIPFEQELSDSSQNPPMKLYDVFFYSKSCNKNVVFSSYK